MPTNTLPPPFIPEPAAIVTTGHEYCLLTNSQYVQTTLQ